MDLDRTTALIVAAVGVISLLTAVVGWLRWARPKTRRVTSEIVAVRDSILGRDAVVDSITGKEIAPALPGIGQRMANVENAVAQIADQHVRIADHERRITDLEKGRVERVATQIESAAMWHGVASLTDDARDED